MKYQGWREQAACDEPAREPAMAGAWIADGWHPLEQEAKKICTTCPVRQQCLKDAVADPDSEGVRGGFKFVGGRILREDVEKASRVLGKKIPKTPRYTRNRPVNEPLRARV
jgi:hypothetical protein